MTLRQQAVDGSHIEFAQAPHIEMQLNDDEQSIEAVELTKLIAIRR